MQRIVTYGTHCYQVLLMLGEGFERGGGILMDYRSLVTGWDSPFEIDLNLQASTSHGCLAQDFLDLLKQTTVINVRQRTKGDRCA